MDTCHGVTVTGVLYPEYQYLSTLISSSPQHCRRSYSSLSRPFWYSLALGYLAVPLSNLIGLIQSVTLWLPFLSMGHAHLMYWLAVFGRSISDETIPSVFQYSVPDFSSLLDLFLEIRLDALVRLMQPVLVVPVASTSARSRNRRESGRYSSHSGSMISYQSVFQDGPRLRVLSELLVRESVQSRFSSACGPSVSFLGIAETP